jgi:diguanylate cyclase (GGDEF)-like protein
MQRALVFVTAMAFIVLVCLIAALATNSIVQLQQIDRQMRTVIELHNRKIDLITQTQVAAHLRSDSLFRMILDSDPFERDVHFMEFNRAGFLVGSGRNELSKLGFTPQEQRNFDSQTRLATDIQAIQEHVVDLLSAERSTEARRVLVNEAIPLQASFNLRLAEMRNFYQQANLGAQREARLTYQKTFRLSLAYGILAVALAFLVAWLTLRQIALKSRQVEQQLIELKSSRAALKEEATHDALTGLANRRLFYDRLQQAMRHAHRYGGKVGILFIDLDRFKEINDHHGHHVGDAVLTEVAKRLTAGIRGSDSVARLGGDEFVVLLDGVQGREDCLTAALKIEQELGKDRCFFGLDLEITASIGQAMYPDDGEYEDELMRAADAAMYRIKYGCDTAGQGRLAFSQ